MKLLTTLRKYWDAFWFTLNNADIIGLEKIKQIERNEELLGYSLDDPLRNEYRQLLEQQKAERSSR